MFDAARHEVRVDGEPLDLTPREFEILRVLLDQRRPARDQGPAAARGLGRGVPGRGQLRLRPRQPAPAQARRGRPDGALRDLIVTEPGVGYRVRELDRPTDFRPTLGATGLDRGRPSWGRRQREDMDDLSHRPAVDGRPDPRPGDGLVREAIAMVAGGGVAARRRRRPALRRGAARAGARAWPRRPASGSSRCGCPTTPAPTSRSSGSAMPDRSRRVLIVEDDESLRRIVARHLRGPGLRASTRPSAEAAVDGARRRPAPRPRAPGPEPARRHRLGPAPRPGARGRRLAARGHHERDDGQPEAARRVRRAPATCPSRSRSRPWSRRSSGSSHPEERGNSR